LIDLQNVLSQWETDSQINKLDLDEESRKASNLHAKYLKLYSLAKIQLKRAELDQKILLKDKWLYYGGKMDAAAIDDKGWKYDPFDGMSKPLKGDMEMYYSTDEDIVRIKAQIDYQKTIIETLEEIMGAIRWRGQHIKNVLEFKKFTSGM